MAGRDRAAPDGSASCWTRLQRILAATDGSRTATEAVALAIDLAAGHGCELHVVHVVPAVDVVLPLGVEAPGEAFRREPGPSDVAMLEEAEARAVARGVPVTTDLLGGPGSGLQSGMTAETILAYAEVCDADLVVAGSCGHGAVASAMLGSVSLRLLRSSKVPVLLVRGERPPPRGVTRAVEPGSGHARAAS